MVLVPLASLAYFLVAPALPVLPAGDVALLVAGGIGLVCVGATAMALMPTSGSLYLQVLMLLSCALLVGWLNAGGAGAAANVPEALLASAIGLLFARYLSAPVVAIAVPLFVSAIDVWSVMAGPTSRLLSQSTDRVDALSFDIPAWGGGSVGQLGFSDAVFVALFAAWAWRYDFRPAATVAGLLAGLVAALALSLLLDTAIPAMPLIAAGYLLPNIDRVRTLLQRG